ncbi:hypothetical protein RMCBS344292_08494 [Rhizopus microsporus]|nr:hypothetical protein RMCBS344292_08494 [Rhizopus microsporus]
MTEQQLRSLQIIAASNGASGGDSSAPDISSDSPAPNEPTSPTNTMLLEVRDYLISDMTNFVNEEDTNDNPWMFKDINISDLFRKYQAATSEILVKHKALPVESYVHELASLTHILFLCKDQHSEIAEKVFSLKTLQQPMAFFERKVINHNLNFPSNHFLTITNTLTDLSLANKTREQAIMVFTVLASQMNYGQKRLLYGIINL